MLILPVLVCHTSTTFEFFEMSYMFGIPWEEEGEKDLVGGQGGEGKLR